MSESKGGGGEGPRERGGGEGPRGGGEEVRARAAWQALSIDELDLIDTKCITAPHFAKACRR